MAGSPQVVGIILCERVLQDILRKDAVSCINIHNGITTQTFPTVVPLIYIFAQILDVEKEVEYQFKIYNGQKKAVAESPLSKVQPLPNQHMTQKVISAFTGLTFEEEGLYDIVLEIEGKAAGSLPFQVLQVKQEAVC